MNRIDKNNLIGKSPNSKEFKEYKSSLTSLNPIQWEASIGLILGDASLQTQNQGKSYRLKFEWSAKNKAYIDHVYNLFDEWVISPPHTKTRTSPKGSIVENLGFQTISHEAFNSLAELFLCTKINKKIVSENLIFNHLTGRGLAYWFMDDGGRLDYNKGSKNKSLVMNTHSFTELEIISMAKELENKFNLLTEIRSNKSKKIIVIKSDSYEKFFSLISPYIIPEMEYKLP